MRETGGEKAPARPSPRLLVSARAAAKEPDGDERSGAGTRLARTRVEEELGEEEEEDGLMPSEESKRIALVAEGGESRREGGGNWSR
jgi:hypothetical protein